MFRFLEGLLDRSIFSLCWGALLLLAVSGETSAQVAAYQGVAKEDPVEEFESPMVLELPLPDLGDLAVGSTKNIGQKLRHFVCEDTSIHALLVKRGRDKKRDGSLETSLDLQGFLYVRPSFDRLVNVELTLLKDDAVIAKAVKRRIDAEEGDRTKFKTSFKVQAEEFDAIFGQEPFPTLKLVVSVADND